VHTYLLVCELIEDVCGADLRVEDGCPKALGGLTARSRADSCSTRPCPRVSAPASEWLPCGAWNSNWHGDRSDLPELALLDQVRSNEPIDLEAVRAYRGLIRRDVPQPPRSTETLLYKPDEHLKHDAKFPPMRGTQNVGPASAACAEAGDLAGRIHREVRYSLARWTWSS
jgi:hypothetical protein